MDTFRAPHPEPTDSRLFMAASCALEAISAGSDPSGRRAEEAQTWARAAELLAAEDLGTVGHPAVSGSAEPPTLSEPERVPSGVARGGQDPQEAVVARLLPRRDPGRPAPLLPYVRPVFLRSPEPVA